MEKQVSSEGLLAIRGLDKSYRLGSNDLPVLRELSLEVAAGEMLVIMGPSGSGKTTLLNCISGIDVPDGGEVILGGDALDYGSESARTLLRRHRIGMVFQFFNLIPTLTVWENVVLPFYVRGERGKDVEDRVDRLVDEVGMARRRDHYPFQLSGGEMQLTSIARALVHRPDLLLADEPTGNVNPQVGRSIMEILRFAAAREGAGVLMVTHSPEHAAWADRVCFLKDGAIAAEHRQGGRREEVTEIHERLLELGI
jgi:putative ABC transport system ATP-binding protein